MPRPHLAGLLDLVLDPRFVHALGRPAGQPADDPGLSCR